MKTAVKQGKTVRMRVECRACSQAYEFDASPSEAAHLGKSCPDCGGPAVRGVPELDSRAMGTYRYVRELGRMAKVSDRAKMAGKSSECPMEGGGGGGGGCCGGGACGL